MVQDSKNYRKYLRMNTDIIEVGDYFIKFLSCYDIVDKHEKLLL